MTAVALTKTKRVHLPGFKIGAGVLQSGYTSSFGFKTLKGVLLTLDSAEDYIITAAIATGVATITALNQDGSTPLSSDKTAYYIAWGDLK